MERYMAAGIPANIGRIPADIGRIAASMGRIPAKMEGNPAKMEGKPLLPYVEFISSGIFTLRVGPSLKRFDIHKALLCCASEEFKKHVCNDMVEGTSGEMTLADEHEDTITNFAEWVYTGHYPDPNPQSPTNPAAIGAGAGEENNCCGLEGDNDPLMAHAKIYVFADRLNIQKLKQYAFSQLTARIVNIDIPSKRDDRLAIIYLIGYAFDNLPKCEPSEPLLGYLGQYASWILESLREEPEFFHLFDSDIDFAKELLRHVRRGNKSPWGVELSSQERAPYPNFQQQGPYYRQNYGSPY